MPVSADSRAPLQNRLLAALPEAEYRCLLPQLQLIETCPMDVLCVADTPINGLYFPCSGIYVNLIRMLDGQTIGTGLIGNEGIIGVPLYLGRQTTHGTATCEIAGVVARLSNEDFQKISSEAAVLHGLVRRYIAALLSMAEQMAACNQTHPVKGRLAKWLLMIHDRSDTDQFPIRHQSLSEMLGLRRASISLAAEALQNEGAIQYSRGQMTVLDRQKLETSACECYQVTKHAYDQLLGPASGNVTGR